MQQFLIFQRVIIQVGNRCLFVAPNCGSQLIELFDLLLTKVRTESLLLELDDGRFSHFRRLLIANWKQSWFDQTNAIDS